MISKGYSFWCSYEWWPIHGLFFSYRRGSSPESEMSFLSLFPSFMASIVRNCFSVWRASMDDFPMNRVSKTHLLMSLTVRQRRESVKSDGHRQMRMFQFAAWQNNLSDRFMSQYLKMRNWTSFVSLIDKWQGKTVERSFVCLVFLGFYWRWDSLININLLNSDENEYSLVLGWWWTENEIKFACFILHRLFSWPIV